MVSRNTSEGTTGWREILNYAFMDDDAVLYVHGYSTRHRAAGDAAVYSRKNGVDTRVVAYPAALNLPRLIRRADVTPEAIDQMGKVVRR